MYGSMEFRLQKEVGNGAVVGRDFKESKRRELIVVSEVAVIIQYASRSD